MEGLVLEERAYELLRFQALGPLADFDELYPYAETQRIRFDKALDAWDKFHQYQPSAELKAFRTLESMGVFNQSDFSLLHKQRMVTTQDDFINTQRTKTKERHDRLKQEALEIIKADYPEDQWMPLLRSVAGELELDIDVKDPELQKIFEDALAGLEPTKSYRKGETLEGDVSGFLLDGLDPGPNQHPGW